MYKSINQWSFPGGTSVNDCMDMAVGVGFRAFEPALAETGELSLSSSDAEITLVKKMAEDKGIELASLASGLYWAYPLTSDDAAVREKAEAIVRRQLECAKLLGVDAILVVPGTVGSGFWGNNGVSYDAAYDRALEAMQKLAPYARDCGVTIGVENVWNQFLLSPLEMRGFIDAVNSPFVRCYFDVGNVVLFGHPEQWIRILGKRIVRIHVKDYKKSVGTLSGFVDLLCGDVNFKEVVSALKETGYSGPLTAEMGADELYLGNIVMRTSRALDVILENA